MDLSITVTKIRNRWHARLFDGGTVIDEMACEDKRDIGWICREMLRWADKLGRSTDWTRSARRRQQAGPRGRVWFCRQLRRARMAVDAAMEVQP